MDNPSIRRLSFGEDNNKLEVKNMIENLLTASLNVVIAVLAVALLARFGPAPKTNAPIHWLRLEMGDSVKMTIESITIGLAQDFDAVSKLAIPASILEHRPETILARINFIGADWKHDATEMLMLQKSGCNDLLHILDERSQKGVKKAQKWTCVEDGCFDIWTPADGPKGMLSVMIEHEPLNSQGSRSAYSVTEVDE